jgi:hypothetical protein
MRRDIDGDVGVALGLAAAGLAALLVEAVASHAALGMSPSGEPEACLFLALVHVGFVLVHTLSDQLCILCEV